MDHFTTDNSLQPGPKSYLIQSSDIKSVTVQTDDLQRLNDHIQNIQIDFPTVDWQNLLLGGFLTSLLALAYEWFSSHLFHPVYGIASIVFILFAYCASKYEARRYDIHAAKHNAEEAKSNMAEILRKAKIHDQSSTSDNS